jgi:FSR family fosmidomycin resistance protein-like MFS transporter
MSLEKRLSAVAPARVRRSLASFVLVLLGIEFLDEVVYGVREAAWPLVRDELRLSYVQVGLILSLPNIFGNLVEPAYGILADVWRRRVLILAGGIGFTAATLLTGLSFSFAALLAATLLFNPAAGLFVNLSQASLMDAEPERREQNMARWALAGSLGNCVGPIVVAGAVAFALSWRWLFVGLTVLAAAMLVAAWRFPFPAPAREEEEETARPARPTAMAFVEGAREALRALRRREVLRWLVLLQVGDFTADTLRGFLALYFVDVMGTDEAGAALAIAIWTWAGLPSDFLMLSLLERVRGISYLRVSTTFVLILFPAFLLAETYATKVLLLGLLGVANAGWYAILKARLYAEMPGRSGTALTLSNLFGFVGDFVPLALGAFAQMYGLGTMMWLLALGPAVLLAGLLTAPRR